MKTCPKCKSVFEDNNSFCLNDGTVLVEEPPPTVAFRPPSEYQQKNDFTINLPQEDEEITRISTNPSVNQEKRGSMKSFVFLFLGLFIGGGLVLALAFFAISQIGKSNTATSNSATSDPTPQVSRGVHEKKNETRKDSEFNGFVKSENANIRSAPNSSEVMDILPEDDRVNLIERDGFWYRVICEHGVGGWMHGNTLSWSPDSVPF